MGFYLSEEIAEYENDILTNGDKTINTVENHSYLSEREVEILQLICHQHSSKEIGRVLNLTEKTIETHRVHLMLKTHSKNMIGLIIYAIEKGYVMPEFRKKN
ncbi:MAG: response regulator transcription factor [Bacteroidetes bacterium]|nr:response regulator transcription factor [Bacteroidota bacterium]